jgi:ectoine hydroxylase-related dioxygenase (phytanoyl-CoA dioxygenase family)
MFSARFADASTSDTVDLLRRKGYYAVENAISREAADQILADVNDLQFSINENMPANVVHKGQTFANHIFSRSKTAFDIATSDRVTSILREALGPVFRMVGKRVYETRSGFYMRFHSDAGAPCVDPMQLDTVVFIFYLSDVEEGEWQIVEGSHLWGETTLGSQESDEELIARPDLKVVGFKMPKGSLVVYNGRVLHRAKPYVSETFSRRSFFFQVNRDADTGEPILIDAGFIRPNLSEDAKMLMGFGKLAIMPPYPRSTPDSLPIGAYDKLDDYLLNTFPIKRVDAMRARRAAAAVAATTES